LKVALTVVVLVSVTAQVPVPEQPPPNHPANAEPGDEVAVRVTRVPLLYASLQSDPQLRPAGLDVTVPAPVPSRVTFNTCWVRLNVAPTVVGPIKLIVQVSMPEHAPDQPANVDPAFGTALSVTVVPCVNDSLQSEPQLTPLGLEATVPAPLPDLLTVTGYWFKENVAVTVVPVVTVSVHGAVPVQSPPDHPVNEEPVAGAAVKVISVPTSYASRQSVPQSIPGRLDDTTPVPLPARRTMSVVVGGACGESSQAPAAITSAQIT
jgi:hypothetical protein